MPNIKCEKCGLYLEELCKDNNNICFYYFIYM